MLEENRISLVDKVIFRNLLPHRIILSTSLKTHGLSVRGCVNKENYIIGIKEETLLGCPEVRNIYLVNF